MLLAAFVVAQRALLRGLLEERHVEGAGAAARGEARGELERVQCDPGVTLCVLEELPLADAARTLKVPVGTVKSRLSRAKQRLAELTAETTAPDATILEGGAR